MDDNQVGEAIDAVLAAVQQAFTLQGDGDYEAAAEFIGVLMLTDFGNQAVAVDMLLSLGALALRRQITHSRFPSRHVELSVLLARLDAEGNIPWDVGLQMLGDVIVWAASTAGGVRPPLQPLLDQYRDESLVAAAWIASATSLRWASDTTMTPAPIVASDVLGEFADRLQQ